MSVRLGLAPQRYRNIMSDCDTVHCEKGKWLKYKYTVPAGAFYHCNRLCYIHSATFHSSRKPPEIIQVEDTMKFSGSISLSYDT